jgi:hypothetical protein
VYVTAVLLGVELILSPLHHASVVERGHEEQLLIIFLSKPATGLEAEMLIVGQVTQLGRNIFAVICITDALLVIRAVL